MQSLRLQVWKGGELSYVVSSAVAKLSVGFFLLRVTVSKVHRRILHVAMIVTAVCGVVFFFILLLQCVPVSYFWDQVTGSEKGHCMPNLLVMGGSFAYMIAGGTCDFIFGLLPIWIVWPLKTGYWVKVGLVFILGLGALYVFPVPLEQIRLIHCPHDISDLLTEPQSRYRDRYSYAIHPKL